MFIYIYIYISGIILETKCIRKIQKRKKALFHYKKVKNGTPNLTFPSVHSLFTIVVIKCDKTNF